MAQPCGTDLSTPPSVKLLTGGLLVRVQPEDAFAAALIATELREGHMTCLVFSSKTREIGVHFVRLSEKQLNAIRRLKVDLPAGSGVA